MPLILWPALEKATWIEQSGLNINLVPTLVYDFQLTPDGWLKVTNVTGQSLGGALVTTKVNLPSYISNYSFVRLSMTCKIAKDDLINLGRFENDVKICTLIAPTSSQQIPNIVNGSTQLNLSTGSFQIDNSAPQWTDTGFKPTIPADTEFEIIFDYQIDWINKKFSVLDVSWNGVKFTIPSAMQGLNWQNSNWQATVAAIQLQTESLQHAVTCYYKDICLAFKDGAFV